MTLNGILKKHSIFPSWLLSYISVLLIPLTISIIVSFEAKNIVESQVNRSNIFLLRQMQGIIDNQIKDVEELGTQIAFNPNVQRLMYVNRPLQAYDQFTIAQAVNDFKNYKVAKGFVDDFYVYFSNLNIILTSNTCYDESLLYERYYNHLTYNYWSNLMNGKYKKDFLTLNKLKRNKESGKTLVFAQSLPVQSSNETLATIFIIINETQLINSIKGTNWGNEGVVFIVNSDNSFISSGQSFDLPQHLNHESLNSPNGLMHTVINNENYTVSYISSQTTKLKYVSIIPEKLFNEKVKYIRQLTLWSFLLCLVVGGFAAYMFTSRNFKSINELVKSIAVKARVPYKKGYNEYYFINEAISTITDEKEKISEKLKRQNKILKSNLLLRLLKGNIGNIIETQEIMKLLGISFISEYFVVMLFYIEDTSIIFKNEIIWESDKKLEIAHYIMSNVVNDLIEKKIFCYMFEVDNMMACLINIDDSKLDNAKQDTVMIAEEAQQLIQEKYLITSTISISEMHKSIINISKAYHEALEAMENKLIIGGGRIIQFSDIRKSIRNRLYYYYSIESEQRLINCIKTGNYDTGREILNDMLNCRFAADSSTTLMSKCLMFGLINTMMKILDEVELDDAFINNLNAVERLMVCETVIEVEIQIKDILKEICQYINSHKKSHNEYLKDNILEFIKESFSNEDLCLNMIAEHVNISPKYLSKFFREQTGMGILDYINKIRMEKAKQLLREEHNLSILEAAKKVGYYDSNALIRIFKKYEGVTPGQYKGANLN